MSSGTGEAPSARFQFALAHPAQDRSTFLASFRGFAAQQGWLPSVSSEAELIFEEWLANLAAHGGTPALQAAIRISIDCTAADAIIEITDGGPPFDPTQQPAPDTSLPLEQRPLGGLGIFMIRKLAAEMRYRRENGRNILTLRKDLQQPSLGAD